jgi:hypothetical protein
MFANPFFPLKKWAVLKLQYSPKSSAPINIKTGFSDRVDFAIHNSDSKYDFLHRKKDFLKIQEYIHEDANLKLC